MSLSHSPSVLDSFLCLCDWWAWALLLVSLSCQSFSQVSIVEMMSCGWGYICFVIPHLYFCHSDCRCCNFTLVFSVHRTYKACLSWERNPSYVDLSENSSIFFLSQTVLLGHCKYPFHMWCEQTLHYLNSNNCTGVFTMSILILFPIKVLIFPPLFLTRKCLSMVNTYTISCLVVYCTLLFWNNKLWQLNDRKRIQSNSKHQDPGVAVGKQCTEITAWLPACPSK